MLQKKIIKLLVFCETSFKFVSEVSPLPLQLFSFIMQLQKRLTGDMQVFLHTLFLEYAAETGGNKCKAVFYTYKRIGVQSLELFNGHVRF